MIDAVFKADGLDARNGYATSPKNPLLFRNGRNILKSRQLP
jgi:hypothetical protein